MGKALLAAAFSHRLLIGQTEVRKFRFRKDARESKIKLIKGLDPHRTLLMSGIDETELLYQLVHWLVPEIICEIKIKLIHLFHHESPCTSSSSDSSSSVIKETKGE